ncbi:MAG: tetratricopeptide repeat protein [Gallionella sp.]|nr:tetratricopeptide repeat protein [Gallionella sp.]
MTVELSWNRCVRYSIRLSVLVIGFMSILAQQVVEANSFSLNAVGINTGTVKNEVHNYEGIAYEKYEEARWAYKKVVEELEVKERVAKKSGKENSALQYKLKEARRKLALADKQLHELEAKIESINKQHEKELAYLRSNPPTTEAIFADATQIALGSVQEMLEQMTHSEAERQAMSKALAEDDKRLDVLLRVMVNATESMDDKEKVYWLDIMPNMTLEQQVRLFDILSMERLKLAELEKKYQAEIKTLSEKHANEWLELNQKNSGKDGTSNSLLSAVALVDTDSPDSHKVAEKILKSLEERGSSHEVHFQLGRLYFNQKRWVDAEAEFKAAMSAASENGDYAGWLAWVYLEQEDKGKALATFAHADKLGMANWKLLRLYGRLLIDAKRYVDAATILAKGLAIQGKDLQLLWQAATAQRELGNYSRAMSLLNEALKLKPSNYELNASLGWLWYVQKQYPNAGKAFLSASRFGIINADAWMMAGLSLVEQGRFEPALSYMQSALTDAQVNKVKNADVGEIRLGLAVLLAESGKLAEARTIMNDAVESTQHCNSAYMGKNRNWHDRMIFLLEKHKPQLCG